MKTESALASTAELVAALRRGEMVIVVDDETRENEGDLLLAADFVTPEAVNFMAKEGRGLICLAMSEAMCQRLELPLMTEGRKNASVFGTNFTVSIEAANGVTTGISSADRAHTIRTAVAANARPSDVVTPGHVFPLMARKGGVLVRPGHTEAGCDLAQMAGCSMAAVICEIMQDDGSMARLPELLLFAARHGMKVGSIADLVRYRSQNETLVTTVAERSVVTQYGAFRAVLFADKVADGIHCALCYGDLVAAQVSHVRVHHPTSLLDFLEPERSRHSWTMSRALQKIQAEGCGVVLLLNCGEAMQDFAQRFQAADIAFPLPQRGEREIGIGAQILRALGLKKMKVLGRHQDLGALSGFGLEVVEFIP